MRHTNMRALARKRAGLLPFSAMGSSKRQRKHNEKQSLRCKQLRNGGRTSVALDLLSDELRQQLDP